MLTVGVVLTSAGLCFLPALVGPMHSVAAQPALQSSWLQHSISHGQGDLEAHQGWELSHFPHLLLTLDSLLLVHHFNQTHLQACCPLAFPFAACMATARPGILHCKLREPPWLQSCWSSGLTPTPLLVAPWMNWRGVGPLAGTP